ncbi:MAG: hypothetical protein IJZ79_01445 [Bacilli bacterium]|nr:hypothetical protein [Bacilli bacterium]
MKLSSEQKEYIVRYIDEINGGTYNENVNKLVAPNYEEDSKDFVSSADLLLYFINKGIYAVEHNMLTFNQLIGKDPL